MNVTVVYNKKKHKINIHKLDSILGLKNKINKRLFNESKNLENIEIFYKNKKLNNECYCDKENIHENDSLIVHLKRKGGNKKKTKDIFFYIGCVITILIPFFILPTGINTGGVSIIAIILGKAKDEFSRYLLCELKYRTLTKRIGNVIDWVKYLLFFIATYVLITLGCVTACLLSKGSAIFDNPKKICMPYYVGSTAGLIITIIYFFIYFLMRYAESYLTPIELWAKENALTNYTIRPFVSALSSIFKKIKYVFCYIIPFGIGTMIKIYHSLIDSFFPVAVSFLDTFSEIGCTNVNMNNLMNKLKTKLKKAGKEINNNKNEENNENQKENKKENNDKSSKKLDMNKLYNIKFQNGMIDHNKYDEIIEELRKHIKPELHPLCKTPPEGSCCQRQILLNIADGLNEQMKKDPTLKTTLDNNKLYLPFLLALEGMYEKVLYDDSLPIVFEGKNTVEKKIVLKYFYEETKKKLLYSNKNNEVSLIQNIDQVLSSEDSNFDTLFNKFNLEKKIYDYLHKDDVTNEGQIIEINQKIAKIQQEAQDIAKIDGSKVLKGNSSTKMLMKIVIINAICNVFTSSKSMVSVVDEIGGLNQLIDILKCGSGAGAIIALIYIITIIILVICGFLNIY